MFYRVVSEGIEDGPLPTQGIATRTLPSNLIAVDLWYRKIDGQTAQDLRELASEVVDLIVGGIAAPPERSS